MKAPIILAIDTPELDIALRWIEATTESVSVFKLGLEFYLTHGAAGVQAVKSATDSEIFLDLKLHDIPHTVEGAAKAVAHLAPRFLTVHASGGTSMIKAAVSSLPHTDVTAVTILTSLSEEDLFEIGYANPALESAVALAKMSRSAGARAIVCSPLEISAIRSAVGPEPFIITPGVRPSDPKTGEIKKSDDQVRTMTPRAAIERGASFVVIGRPITGSWVDGAQAMRDQAAAIADQILS